MLGGRGQLLDLVAQHGELLAGLLEDGGELLVLRGDLGELALGLEQPLLHHPDPARGVLQPAAQDRGLLLERPNGGAQRRRLVLRALLSHTVSSSSFAYLAREVYGRGTRSHGPSARVPPTAHAHFAGPGRGYDQGEVTRRTPQ